MIVHSNEKGLEKELDQLTSRLVIAMANRESLEEVMVIIISFTLYYISTCRPNHHIIHMSKEEEAVVCAGCKLRLLEPGLQTDQGRFSQYEHIYLSILKTIHRSTCLLNKGFIHPVSLVTSAQSL